MNQADQVAFVAAIDGTAKVIYYANCEKGFWPADPQWRNKAEFTALVHSELSEYLKATRRRVAQPSEKIPDFSEEEEELADAMIRILDAAGGYDYRLGDAILAKLKYNASRPHKHGKRF
jgi:NTP pyrophosphatase (non-canonical NTP hydrolase)